MSLARYKFSSAYLRFESASCPRHAKARRALAMESVSAYRLALADSLGSLCRYQNSLHPSSLCLLASVGSEWRHTKRRLFQWWEEEASPPQTKAHKPPIVDRQVQRVSRVCPPTLGLHWLAHPPKCWLLVLQCSLWLEWQPF